MLERDLTTQLKARLKYNDAWNVLVIPDTGNEMYHMYHGDWVAQTRTSNQTNEMNLVARNTDKQSTKRTKF